MDDRKARVNHESSGRQRQNTLDGVIKSLAKAETFDDAKDISGQWR